MSSIDSSMTVGVFRDEEQAQQALASLQSASFQQIQFFRPGRAAPQPGGLFGGIKRLFAGDNEGIARKLTDTGASEADARYYQQEYETGGIIVAVRAGERKQEALDILRRYDAYDAYTRNRKATTIEPSTDSAPETTSISKTESTPALQADPIVETGSETRPTPETTPALQADPTVETGSETTLVSEIRPTPETIPAVEIAPASKKGEDEEARIPATVEHVEVAKTPVISDEISVQKRPIQEKQQVAETTKHEEPRVEQKGDAPIHSTPGDRFHNGKQRQNSASKPHAKSRKKH